MNEFRRQCPPMKRVFEKIPEGCKALIATEISRLLTVGRRMSKMLETYPLETHNLEAAIIALGFATAQVSYITKITERIKSVSGMRFFVFPAELYDLREHCKNQLELCQQLVYGCMAKEVPLLKEKANVQEQPTQKEVQV